MLMSILSSRIVAAVAVLGIGWLVLLGRNR